MNPMPDPHFPTLHFGHFALIQMELEHAEGYAAILSDPTTYAFLTEGDPLSVDQAKEKIRRNQHAWKSGRSIYWSIVDTEGIFLGFVAIHSFQEEKVSISFGIHPAHRRKGIACQVLSQVLRWEGLDRKTAELATHKENIASFQLLTKLKVPYFGYLSTPFGERHVFRT